MRRFLLLGISLFSLLLSAALPAQAFKLIPLSRVFAPSGPNAIQSYEIENTTGEPLAVELNIVKREMSLQGVDKLIPANDDFMVYPPQVLLQPSERQTVRVTWLGDPKPTQELAYRLIAEQLPINLAPTSGTLPAPNDKSHFSTNIKITMRYQGSIYIRPSQAQPNVVIERIEPKLENGKSMLSIILQNQGTARANLKEGQIQLKVASQNLPSLTLTAVQMGLNERPTLLAKQKRQILIPYPAALPQGEILGTLSIPYQNR
jgi:fimbrial chaperone protein